jgi:hypothetical protein
MKVSEMWIKESRDEEKRVQDEMVRSKLRYAILLGPYLVDIPLLYHSRLLSLEILVFFIYENENWVSIHSG